MDVSLLEPPSHFDDLLVLYRYGRACTYQWATLTPCDPRGDLISDTTSSADGENFEITLCGLIASAKTLHIKVIPNSDYFVTICEDPQLAECRTQVHMWRNSSLELGQ